MITSPFVVGLALTMMLAASGVVTQWIEALTGFELGRWLDRPDRHLDRPDAVLLPISFLILIGVVDGVSPSMEEASQTLRSDRWRTFRKVSLPLMAPGLANAFLIGFIESMADFGNPLVLGGSGGVCRPRSLAVVGAQNDPARAAVLATVLLIFTLSAFLAQRFWLAGRNFATVTGKGDGGRHAMLPARVAAPVIGIVLFWGAFTIAVYALILFGGFVRVWGLDHSLTFEHYQRAFGVALDGGLRWTGVAWNSFWTTMRIALLAAPLTAAVGLLTAWLIVRQRFPGRAIFEFALMMSFAILGTVIGISYIMAFNLPPVQMTGTAAILIACFVFRNMPVGVRGGVAAMAQLDGSLDERIADPWRRLGPDDAQGDPAPDAARDPGGPRLQLVRAITSISAVIFLVSAKYNMATAYIVGLVENGEYGIAIAYSSVLIVVMITVIGGFQLLVGERQMRRREHKLKEAAA
ncbi:MAG: iron ABC transporter permease [Defluviimonas denitrificans]